MHRDHRIDRRALFWMTRRLYAARTAAPFGPGGPDGILVVRVDERVGNLVTLQSMLDALRSHLPAARLDLLASSRATQVTSGLQGIGELYELDKRWFFKRPATWHRTLKLIRRQAYPVAIDASAWHEFSFTHASLTYFSGAPFRIGFSTGRPDGFHTHLVDPGPEDEHELAQRMRLLAPLGFQDAPPELRCELGKDHADRFEAWLQSRQMARPRVGIWAGSRKLERRWPLDYYTLLGRRLQQDRRASLVLLWGPGEENLRDALADALPDRTVVAPPTRIAELAGFIRRLDLMVTNDTGPMHLAVALGTPTVTLFASGEPGRWGHPYAWVRNLRAPGKEPEEVHAALDACQQLLGSAPKPGSF